MSRVSISEDEYKELLSAQEVAKEYVSLDRKCGRAYERLKELEAFDKYAKQTFPVYRTMWARFREDSKRAEILGGL